MVGGRTGTEGDLIFFRVEQEIANSSVKSKRIAYLKSELVLLTPLCAPSKAGKILI